MKLALIAEKKKKKKTPKPEDFDERTACHMQCDLDNSIDEEYDKDLFDYNSVSKEMWDEKISDAKKEFEVDFSTENDDTVDQQKTIEVDDTKFACEMYSAGGDWEFPLRYFRCQLKDGYAGGLSKYSNPHFVFIPNGDEGNGQLEKSDKGKWSCPNSDCDEEEKRDEDKCWDSLEKYLKDLVKNQTLPESTCSRALSSTPKRSRRSLVTLGIPSQRKTQKLRHIS